MQPLELAGIALAVSALGVVVLVARRRRADFGWWIWAWAVLVAAGIGLQLGAEWAPARAGGAFLAVLFPGMQLAGSFEYAERTVPRWLIPGFVALAVARLLVAAAGFETHSHLAVVAFELAALLAAAVVILRARREGGVSPIEWVIVVGFAVIGAAELIDAILDTRGAGVSWPVWLAIGVPIGSCQAIATFERLQHQLSVSVAERERALQQVEDGNERFRAIADEADDVILEATPERGILYANPRLHEVLGYAPEEVLGSRISDFAFDRSEFPKREDLLGQRRQLLGPVRVRHRDGSPRWMETSLRSYQRGDEMHLVVIARDVSERLRSDEQARKAQKLESLGLMAGGIAHDFNNLLMGILCNIDLARLELPVGHPALEFVKRALDASEQAAQLTRQLQAYAGSSPLQLRSLDVTKEIRSKADLLHTAVGERATLELDLAEGLPAVEADSGLLLQAVLNLVINAAEACEDSGGVVRVVTGLARIDSADTSPASGQLGPGAHVFVEVQDDGPGVHESIRDRMFDPFFTTHATGRGLGLAVVHGVVKTLRGGMTLDSAPDGGARFRLLLKISGGSAVAGPGLVARTVEGQERVLLVDDDAIVLDATRAALERHGYEVVTAASGERAKQVVREQEIALILLDAVMPGERVEEILGELHALVPGAPVLVISGYAEADAMRQLAQSGAVSGFLAKPFTSAVLAARVRELLDDEH